MTKSGSFFSYGDERLGQGRNNAKIYLNEHPDMAKEIEQRIYAALGVSKALVVPIERSGDGGRGEAPATRARSTSSSEAAAITIADERAA